MRKGAISLVPVLVVFFSLAAFLSVMYLALPESKTTTTANKNKNPATNSQVEVTNDNTNSAPEEENTSSTTTSYGLWYPFSASQTINNPRPVIYGKVSQAENTYLATTFTKNEWPGRDFQEAKTLSYLTGEVRNLSIQLDDVEVSGVQGFPQYPNLACYRYVTDPVTGGQIPEYYNTVSECQAEFRDRLPALIFVFRPSVDLRPGEHILSVGGAQMKFTYNPSYTIASQKTQTVNTESTWSVFDHNDSCAPGYYQRSSDFPLPLPIQQNKHVYYGLSFPQSEDEKGSINRRQVWIALEGRQYPIFFPDSLTYFEGVSAGTGSGRTDYGLFLPMDQLVYSNGIKASPWGVISGPKEYRYVSSYYTELYPVDVAGREYRGRSLPWVMETSSGCDG